MVADTLNLHKREKFSYDEETHEKLFDLNDEMEFKNSERSCDENMNTLNVKNMNDNDNETKKPRSILINHENENITKKTKPNRFVSFTLDESKKPFTSSIYYGVKSYLHHFYEPLNKATFDGENSLEDDFEFVVEPGKRRKNFWFLISILVGVALLLLGMIVILIANLTPPANPIVGIKHNLEIVDQKAIAFNQKIEMSQYLGLIIFGAGGIVIMLTLLVATYEQECGCMRSQMLYPSTMDTNAWIRYAEGYPSSYDSRIPLSEEIKAVQIERVKQ